MGIRLAAEARELYRSGSGTTVMNARFENDTEELRSLMEQLQSNNSSPGQTKAEKQLSRSVKSCIEASNTLLELLDELKVKDGRKSKLAEVIKRTLFDESKRDKVIQLHNRLQELEDSTMLRIVVTLREDQSSISKAIRSLHDDNRRLEANTTQKLDLVHRDLKMLFDKIPTDPLSKALEDPRKVASIIQTVRNVWPKDLQLNALGEETINAHKQQKLLRSLQFPEIRVRHQSIKEAHPKTFKWILKDKNSTFRDWLEAGEGIYWISGKAGSGKSTLMRFLVERRRVAESLTHWASGRTLLMASHFFWHAGSPIQKSREGLFRTLLFQILRQVPGLIKSLFPSRWDGVDGDLEPWSEKELLQALKQLPLESSLPLRFCFFVDGLDEYTAGAKKYYGDFQELIELFDTLSASPVVKICVSSRPWTAFERVFKGRPNQLRLEDLTKDDIKHYVLSKFQTSHHFQPSVRDDDRCETLLDSIVQKARGVFLWVHLVVESLLRGASAGDNFHDLQIRLNEIPEDLGDYFEHMLRKIEPVYLNDTICIFRFAVDAEQSLPLLAYHFLGRLLLGHTESPSTESYSGDDLREIHIKTKVRLNARCKDLLEEVHRQGETSLMSFRVDFLHRTVRDFLLESEFLDKMMNERKVKFDSLMSLSQVMLALVKTSLGLSCIINRKLRRYMTISFADFLMHYAHRIEQDIIANGREEINRLDATHKLLDEFSSVIFDILPGRHTPGYWQYEDCLWKAFLAYAIDAKLLLYVTAKLDANPEIVRKEEGIPLLQTALCPTPLALPETIIFQEGPYLPLVKLLLSRGADPNEEVDFCNRKSPWITFLTKCGQRAPHIKSGKVVVLPEVYDIMKLMVSHGADYGKHFPLDRHCGVGLSDLQVQILEDIYKSHKAEFGWATWLSGQLSRAKLW
ncbi:hypothetical protein O1611_g5334 [Lasiodiplodia mahajangana]|uniref:Uncharacterized protein n=1 Tax=Lasiodiplodia mahajangana TaxID=1108764 RepID=A0ACC2JLB7_9PEZI|nr:hypothetical protein O1611_g5334 [Lasiodiplodia mahajangana]